MDVNYNSLSVRIGETRIVRISYGQTGLNARCAGSGTLSWDIASIRETGVHFTFLGTGRLSDNGLFLFLFTFAEVHRTVYTCKTDLAVIDESFFLTNNDCKL